MNIEIKYPVGSTVYVLENNRVETVKITGFKISPAPFNNYSTDPEYRGDSTTTSYYSLYESEIYDTKENCIFAGIKQLINDNIEN